MGAAMVEAKTSSPGCRSVLGRGTRTPLAVLGAMLVLFLLTEGKSVADNRPRDSVEVSMVWDSAPHNGFTDLVQFGEEFFLAFREGTAHDSLDGRVRVLVSLDGGTWESAALLVAPDADLRDPKFSITPQGMLMLNAAASRRDVLPSQYQSVYWLSSNGRTWSGPVPFGHLNDWLWRVAWKDSIGYSVGYRTITPYQTTLYSGSPEEGVDSSPVISPLVSGSYVNETVLVVRPNTDLLALTRRDPVAPYTTSVALLGNAVAPYTSWEWIETDCRLGGPDMLELPHGRIAVGARVYTPITHTGLLWLNAQQGTLTEFLELPSGGDTGYPGIIVHGDELWVSYYSSHEGKASIYLATGISIVPPRARVYLPVAFGMQQLGGPIKGSPRHY